MMPRADSRRVTTGIVFAALAAVSFSSAGLVANHLVDDGAPGVVVAFYEAAFGFLFVVGVRLRGAGSGRWPGRASAGWIAATAALFAVAGANFYTALARIDFSVAAPIVGAVPLASYLFVLVALRGHERLGPRVVVGAALVVAGVGLVGVAN